MSDKKLKVVLALGYFDSVHIGHQKVIKKAVALAKEKNATPLVYTFGDNPRSVFTGEQVKVVYTKDERRELYRLLGVEKACFTTASKTFLSRGKRSFLNLLNSKYDVLGYVCGEDYTFGKGGKGNVAYLKSYAEKIGQFVEICKIVTSGNEKVSSTLVKELLSSGKVKTANELLGREYSISGKVISDRHIGKTLGFPTLNVKLNSDKQRLKDGVYAGYSYIDGVKYQAVINYGARPTFGLDEKLVEAHLIGFDGNLYGKNVTVYFIDFVREVVKFDSVNELVEQLKKDLITVKEMKND